MRKLAASAVIAVFFVAEAIAGGGPQNLLIVVNDNSRRSLELGRYYAEMRGVPEQNICHIRVATNESADTVTYSNDVRAPVIAYLGSAGISNQIDVIAFSMDIPYRVFLNPAGDLRWSSLTASTFYGFKSSPSPFVFGCELAVGSEQSYFESERTFTHAGGVSSNRYYLSAMITSTNLDAARRLVDRAVMADSTMPTSQVFLLHSTDVARNGQWVDFEGADFASRFLAIPQQRRMEDADTLLNRTNVIGASIGVKSVGTVNQNIVLPGAFGSHLTSFGGYLYGGAPEPAQMSVLAWIHAGFAGSYGTVVEPCSFPEKFANPRVHFWYARGFSLGESLWMSVKNPYQGVFVGDPLCAPYAAPPEATVEGLAENAVVTGTLTITGRATHASANVSRLDLYLDGRAVTTLVALAPSPGNSVRIAANGVTSSYTVVANDTLFTVAHALAQAVSAGGSGIIATARGDRVELVRTNFGVSGSSIAYEAEAVQGTAAVLSVSALAMTTNLLDTTYPAREFIALSGTGNSGDTVTCIVTLTNGVVATNTLTAFAGQTASNALEQLMGMINSNVALQVTNGVVARYFEPKSTTQFALEARTPGPEGHGIVVEFEVDRAAPMSGFPTSFNFTDNMNDNVDVLRARGEVLVGEGAVELAASHVLNTTGLADGPHELMVVAYDGSAVKTQGRATVPFVVDNNTVTSRIDRPISGEHVLQGASITVSVFAATGVGVVTQVVLRAEGRDVATTSAPPYDFVWSTTNIGAGNVPVQALAWNSLGESSLSDILRIAIFTDDDSDGVADQWEYLHFGSAGTFGGTNDPDGDGVSNRDEYIADTQPTNAASLFLITTPVSPGATSSVTFVSSTTRFYRVEGNSGDLTTESAWSAMDTNLYRGDPIVTTMPVPATNDIGFYRIRVERR